uniref:Uncharacterized protein n=2 Tax=unclassified Caudoviricetes TaxID=2788787 RepID=A0A8S5PJN2_9CAUD|nr:MAG TPA: hypothetical protein [Siphoviridae sp. ctJcm18]DAE06617.1 MAG TPA: hypothetical protein [Siphoviridae sp. ctUGQ45]
MFIIYFSSLRVTIARTITLRLYNLIKILIKL